MAMTVVFSSTEQRVVYDQVVRLRQTTKYEGQFLYRFFDVPAGGGVGPLF